MTVDLFERQIDRLKPLGEASDQFKDAYWDALRDIPDDVFEAAIGHALKTRAWFPKPAELRMDADHVARQVRPVAPLEDRSMPLAQPFTITVPEVGTIVSVTREWRFYCEVCADSGWATFWCGVEAPGLTPWHGRGSCERRQAHGPHEWVKHCHCFESNPALVRKREQGRQFAAATGKRAVA